MLKILSIVHPALQPSITAPIVREAFAARSFDAQVMVPRAHGASFGAELRRALQAIRPDVVHLHADPCSRLAWLVERARRRHARGAALVVECEHAISSHHPWPFSMVRRRILAASRAAIARHNTGMRLLVAAGFKGTAAIVAPPCPGAVQRPRTEAGPGSLVIGYSGALQEGHGIVDVLEGIAACRAHVALVIQGEGPLRAEIVDRAAALGARDRVHLRGPDTGPQRFDDVDAMIVMPRSRHAARAPFDRTIAAAQSAGLPVIVSRAAGLGEIVGAGGWLTEPGDPGLLCGLLQRLAGDPAERARVAEAAGREAISRYAEPAVQDGLRRAFEAACAARSTAPAPAPAHGGAP